LRGLGKIVVADFGEVALLPEAAVNEGDLVLGEFENGIFRGIGEDGIGKFAWIADDIGHGRFLPAGEDLGVAFLAGARAGVMGRGGGRSLLSCFFPAKRTKTADEEHEFPGVVGGNIVRPDPAGHAGEADAIADDVAEFAVREILRLRGAEIGDFGIEVAADGGLPGTVRSVADGAFIEINVAGIGDEVRGGLERIGFVARG